MFFYCGGDEAFGSAFDFPITTPDTFSQRWLIPILQCLCGMFFECIQLVQLEDAAEIIRGSGAADIKIGVNDPAQNSLNKKGRGWKISEKRLDELHDRAREMRRFASPANKARAISLEGSVG